jgi:hypothetical protein
MTSTPLDGLPLVALRRPEPERLRLLRRIQRIVLQHPIATQAAFAALVAEGRRFAATARGRALSAELARSPLLRRARTGFDAATLWMLEEQPASELPSTYVDMLLMAAQGRGLEPLIDRLLREPLGRAAGGDR